MTKEVIERLAKSEVKTEELKQDITSMKEDIHRLQHSVNEELQYLEKRVRLVEKAIIVLKTQNKILGFIGATALSSTLILVVSLIK